MSVTQKNLIKELKIILRKELESGKPEVFVFVFKFSPIPHVKTGR